MSTAYYTHTPDDPEAQVRVGVQSCGWRFMHQGGTGVETRAQWEAWLSGAGCDIISEYGHVYSVPEMIARTAAQAGERSAVQAFHSDPERDAALGIEPGDYWQDAGGHDFTRRGR
ncbi:hypothetical protein IHN32_04290 [Deinococcus sp. 14RED07]|uniref:hypothetical protein n=1 Tax=Deinococcus sp. 14RED07 TaxID=2745874 RepID=UPI001E574CD4|nr:hypothetical protein [Deinococcus sp. 14RED07]MCD0175170.1 hypothetical protein [Deinococcus sp. 14RED07]